MTTIYLIRHAEAEGNIFRRMDGHYNSRITKNGYRQIQALQKRFEAVRIDAVYASDLFRTCETAKALYLPKHLPLHKDARFREICFGVQEDQNFGHIDYFTPLQGWNFSHAPEQWHADGAETYFEATDRFWAGLRELAARHEGQTIAVFSHGGVTGWAMRRQFGADRMKTEPRCDNTGVCLLRWQDGGFVPEYFYDNSHLPEEISTLRRQTWWRGTNDFNLWFRDARAEDAALYDPALLPRPDDVVRIAMRMEEPVGYLSYDPGSGEVSSLYLLPACRHRRMGDQLIGEMVCPCRAAGLTELRIPLPPDNPALLALLDRHSAVLEGGTATLVLPIPSY